MPRLIQVNTKSSVRAWNFSRARFTGAPTATPNATLYPSADELQPQFEPFLNELYDRQNVLAAVLLRAFADMFGEPSDTFSRYFAAGAFNLALLVFVFLRNV